MDHRSWQLDAFKKIDICNSNELHNVIPVNACVGSGKTNVAAYAIGKFIKDNIGGKTFQMFVTPRIRLCAQQADEITAFIEAEFGLVEGRDFDIIRKDCTQHDLDLTSGVFTSKHAIAVVCDESLWGIEVDGTEKRWSRWMHFLGKISSDGYKLGNVALDEAHNYTACRDKIFGGDDFAG